MNRAEAITEIQRGIGFRSDKQDEIISALAQAQELLEGGTSLPWFIISEDETINLVAENGTFTLPTNFIREVEETGEDSFSVNDLMYINKVDYTAAKSRFGLSTAGYPSCYALRRNSLVFFPAPDTDIEITWSYYAKQDSLSTASTNSWLDNIPYLLIGMAGKRVATQLRDMAAVSAFADMESTWAGNYLRKLTAREEANRQYALGSGL